MQNKFIIDKEVNLNESDFLKTKIYADNLTKIINNSEPNKVFTIGLFGNWGTGKSSIVKTSQQDFDENKIRFITYDAWQYVNDSFRRMFLRKLREELRYEETDLMKKFYENESTDIGNRYQLSPTRLAYILGGLIVLLAIFIFIPFKIEYKIPLYSIFTLLGLLITIISGAFHQLKISVTKPHLFAPEQFEECFKEIASNSLLKISKTDRVIKWVKSDNSIQNLEKLIIVIDNIDRCSNEVAYNLLTDIKTFLSSEPYSIVFVIPVDDEALKKHIIKSNSTDIDCNKEKEEFLRKFFNVTIRIKPYGETDMYSFAKQVCEKLRLKFSPETINIASKEYARNPRRVIQLFNNLLAEKNYYDANFAQKKEALICCVLIAKEEYPNYYNAIINSPKIFNEEYTGGEENIKRFVRIAQTALGKVEISDISEVLFNSHHQFDIIAVDIKDAIETFDAERVLSVWDTEKEQISDFIINKLDNAIKNHLTETEMVAYVDLCVVISTVHPLDPHFAKRIDEKTLPYLSTVIAKTKNHESLCKYALLREEQKDNKIKEALVEECKRSEQQDKGLHWKSLFNAVIRVFQDKKTSIALAPTYTLNYDSVGSVELNDFSEEQIESLLSNKFVQGRILELPKGDDEEILLDTETEEYKKVKWLFERKKDITDETYAHLFAKVIGANNDESRMRGKSIDEIAEILDFMNPLLDLIPDRKLTTQPQTLYNLIVNNRQVLNPNYRPNSYPQQPQHIQKNFIDECISEEKYISETTKFVINIYRITNNKTNVKTEIDKILQHTYLNKEFIQLIDKGFTLQPILNSIFDDKDNFKDNDRLAILTHCFNQKDSKGLYEITNEKAKTKLDDLLTYAQAENSGEIFALLETLSNQDRYKTLLSTLIIAKDSAFINSLPQKLLKLAVSSFNKDNYNDYADNFDFLSVIIQNGTNTQKGYVVKILTVKLDNNRNVEQVLNLIDSMSNITSFDKSNLLFSHLDDYQRENNESISQEINDRINQIKEKVK